MVRTAVCCSVIFVTAALFFCVICCTSFTAHNMGTRMDSAILKQSARDEGRIASSKIVEDLDSERADVENDPVISGDQALLQREQSTRQVLHH